MNSLVLQFLQGREARDLQSRLDQLTQEIETVTQQLFAKADVDMSLYRLNVNEGEFVMKES